MSPTPPQDRHADRVPLTVCMLIETHLHSVEQVEALLLLARDPARWWSAEATAVQCHLSAASASRDLEYLASRGLLDVRLAASVVFRYNPVVEPLRSMVADLARAQADVPSSVAALIRDRKAAGIQGFAESFRIGRSDDDR